MFAFHHVSGHLLNLKFHFHLKQDTPLTSTVERMPPLYTLSTI